MLHWSCLQSIWDTEESFLQIIATLAHIAGKIGSHLKICFNKQDAVKRNHLIELAIAAHASFIITNNVSDFANAELKRIGFEVVTPEQILRLLKP